MKGQVSGSVIRADALRADMTIQALPGDAPMRVDRVERAAHNGKPCLIIHGSQAVGGGRLEPVEYWVGLDHTVRLWPLRAA